MPSDPLPLCCSEHIAARSQALTAAFLDKFSPLATTHSLLPLLLHPTNSSVNHILSALTDGSLEPSFESDDDPSWTDAVNLSEHESWIASAHKEIQSLHDLQVFVLVPCSTLPPGCHPMCGKLVGKCKHNDLGTITCYKVRYVVKGYAQCYGVDNDKMTTPTAHLESFCLVLHLTASLCWDLHQFNVKTAFLNGVLPNDEITYMEQPSGFEEPGKEDWVWQLMHSIYGMKQASCIWNHTFDETVWSWGFITNEWCIYICISNTGMTIFTLHVDNILSTSSSAAETNRFKADLQSCWEISNLGPTKFSLSISITC